MAAAPHAGHREPGRCSAPSTASSRCGSGIALAALLGQIGLPGGGFGHGYGSMADVGERRAVRPLPTLSAGAEPGARPSSRSPGSPTCCCTPASRSTTTAHAARYPDIRLVYWAGGNPFHHHQDLNRLRRALARPDTVIVHEPFWTAMARHADIVLPATTTLERNDIGAGRNDALPRSPCTGRVEPVGEARDDYDIFAELAERLGVARRASPRAATSDGWLEHLYDTLASDRSAAPASDVPVVRRVLGDGEVARRPDRRRRPHAVRRLPRRPRGAPPAARRAGRIELFSATIAGFGYDDCPGHPAWLEPDEWLGGARAPPGSRSHLSPTSRRRRLHSQLDIGAHSQAASKVAGREPIRIHPDDAAARGIADGDVVRVFNDRGACLAGVIVSDGVRPGVVQLSTGAWYDPDDPTRDRPLCVHGNPNVLTADVGTSRLAQGCTGQHALVQVERWEGPLPAVRAHQPPAV